MCESMCDMLPSSAANQGDNTVLVAQDSTATLSATKQLLPPDYTYVSESQRSFWQYLYCKQEPFLK